MEDVTRAGEDDKLSKEEPASLTELVASDGCGLVLKLGFWLVEEEEESSGGSDTVLGQQSTTGRKHNIHELRNGVGHYSSWEQ